MSAPAPVAQPLTPTTPIAPVFREHPMADIFLRSSDGIDFRVVKSFLSHASPFFESMFKIPTPAEGPNGDEMLDGLRVIPITEKSNILEALLLLVYPPCADVDPPTILPLEDNMALLRATAKYDMIGARRRARKILIDSRGYAIYPVRIFALACFHKLLEEAKLAAAEIRPDVVTRIISPLPSWYHLISFAQIQGAVKFQGQCVLAVRAAVDAYVKEANIAHGAKLAPVPPLQTQPNTTFPAPDGHTCDANFGVDEQGLMISFQPRWWIDFTNQLPHLLKEQRLDNVARLPGMVNAAANQANKCETCAKTALVDLWNVGLNGIALVEKIILDIEIDLGF